MQLWNFGGEVLDDSHVNMDCGAKVQGQCGGQKSINRLLALIKRIHLPRESVEREQRGVMLLGRGGERGSCTEYMRDEKRDRVEAGSC